MDILCWRWNADLKVEFEDLSRQMSELSRLPAGLRGSIGRQIALVQASAKEEAPVRRFGSGGGELRQSILTQMEIYSDRMVAICYTNKEYAPYVEFGTGPNGEAHHAGISPDVHPVYKQRGWVIPADAMSVEAAQSYGFGIARDGDKVIGYYTRGQAARPFMYPGVEKQRGRDYPAPVRRSEKRGKETVKNVKDEVFAALQAVCDNVSDVYPTSWVDLPAIQYTEEENRVYERTANKEDKASVRYRIDIWNSGSTSGMAQAVDAAIACAWAGANRLQRCPGSIRHAT